SDLAYDFNTLREQGLIEQTYLNVDERDSCGGVLYKNPGLKVTANGLEAITNANKSWLKKGIEHQPMTFLQIIVTVAVSLVTLIGGWLIGRYVTPSGKMEVQPKIINQNPSEKPHFRQGD